MTNGNDNEELYNFLKRARDKSLEIYEEYRKVFFHINIPNSLINNVL